MTRRFLLILTLLSSLLAISVYAESIKPISKPVAVEFPIQATLTLKQQGQRLYAYVLVEQSQNNKGKIRVNWMPPAHSSCDKSSYILSYQGKKFHTQAYRTLGYSLINGKSITCTGTWHATVTDAKGMPLTTKAITIESVDTYATNAKMRSLAAIA